MGEVTCPTAEGCYCRVYGMCNLKCPHYAACDGQYVLPQNTTLPPHWPLIGWNGEQKNEAEYNPSAALMGGSVGRSEAGWVK